MTARDAVMGWRLWQRAVVLAAGAVLVVVVADLVAGNWLAGPSTMRGRQHIVAVLADPSVRREVAPVVESWSAQARQPVRVDWDTSPRIATRIRDGEPVDLVVLVGGTSLRGLRRELAEAPVEVIRPGTWLGTVTNAGRPLSVVVRRFLTAPTS